MTTSELEARPSAPTRPLGPRLYWIATGLFCALFLGSVTLSLADPATTRETMVHLGFPTHFLYPQAIAKLVGVAVILSRRSRTLTGLAFAGFLFDLLLAFQAHIAEGDPDVWLAAFGLVLWGFAFWADHRRFPTAPLR